MRMSLYLETGTAFALADRDETSQCGAFGVARDALPDDFRVDDNDVV